MRVATARMQIYLTATAYVGAASTDTTANIARWLKDGTQSGASTQSATQRFQALLTNAAGN